MRKFSHQKLQALLADPRVNEVGVRQMAGLSYTGFKKIRDGISVPSANTLAALADVFQQPMDYFFESE